MGFFDRKTSIAGVFTEQEMTYLSVLIGRACDALAGERNYAQLTKGILSAYKGLKAGKLTADDIQALKELLSSTDEIMAHNKSINHDGMLTEILSSRDRIVSKPEISGCIDFSTDLNTKIENYIRNIYAGIGRKLERL